MKKYIEKGMVLKNLSRETGMLSCDKESKHKFGWHRNNILEHVGDQCQQKKTTVKEYL